MSQTSIKMLKKIFLMLNKDWDKATKNYLAIQRVREIHKPVEYYGQRFCAVCVVDGIPESISYPCPTIKALDGDTDD